MPLPPRFPALTEGRGLMGVAIAVDLNGMLEVLAYLRPMGADATGGIGGGHEPAISR